MPPTSAAANCSSSRDQLTATLAGLCGDERDRPTPLPAGPVACPTIRPRPERSIPPPRMPSSMRAETARAAAEADCETKRRAAAAAGCRLAETSTRATVLQEYVATQRAELDAATDLLAQERASVSDEDLASAADASTGGGTSRRAAGRRAGRGAGRRRTGRGGRRIGRCHRGVRIATRTTTKRLPARYAKSASNSRFSAARADKASSTPPRPSVSTRPASTRRVGGRARAAQLLRSVMARHRDTTRLRYVEPYRAGAAAARPSGVRTHLRGRHRQRPVHPQPDPGRRHRALTNPCRAEPKSNWASWRGWPARRWSPRRTACRW